MTYEELLARPLLAWKELKIIEPGEVFRIIDTPLHEPVLYYQGTYSTLEQMEDLYMILGAYLKSKYERYNLEET